MKIVNTKAINKRSCDDRKKGFTLIELLIAVSVSSFLFVLVSSILISLFRSDTKSKQGQTLEQTVNDIRRDLTNNVRWSDVISYDSDSIKINDIIYGLNGGRFVKGDTPLSHKDIEVSNFKVTVHTPAIEATQAGNGFGLTGHYYNDSFIDKVYEQIDSQIDFDWGRDSPSEIVNNDDFSIRWSGQIESIESGQYQFFLESDDGARLWIDNALLINAWESGHGSGVVNLGESIRHSVVVEFHETANKANIKLYWKTPSGNKEIVPSTNLYPSYISTSLEISMLLTHKQNSGLSRVFRTILTPRSSIIAGSITDLPIPSPTSSVNTPTPRPKNTPTPINTPTHGPTNTPTPVSATPSPTVKPPTPTQPPVCGNIDEISGWPECNGWNPESEKVAFNPNYDKYACRNKALVRARATYPKFDNQSFYDIGLPFPPSGDKYSTTGGNDRAWFNWGMTKPSGENFLGAGSSCGTGPNYCIDICNLE